MQSIMYHSKIAHHTIKVYKITLPPAPYNGNEAYTGYCFSVTGGKWNVGSLHSQSATPEHCRERAISEVRHDHPRAHEFVIVNLL